MRGGEVLYESLLGLSADGSPGHTTRLLEEVERAAQAAGGWSGVERIAVGLGPGSFTGLRVGIATARALGASTGLPLSGVGTLDALALGHRGGARRPAATRWRSSMPAGARPSPPATRRAAERLWGPWVGTPEALGELLAESPDAALAAGSGAVRFRDELEDRGVEVPGDEDPVHRVAARHVCALAWARGRRRARRSPRST